MKYLPSIPYPDNEKPKLAFLEKLFCDWHQQFVNNGSALKKHTANDLVFDGFCPYYFSQKKRILFIGRETRYSSRENYIDVLCSHYKNKHVGKTHVNADRFHNRMIKIAYGILSGMPEWKDIDDAEKLGEMLGQPDGLSFAFMNISKLSNDSDDFQTDWDVYNEAHRLSTQADGRNFIEEEIAILQPQIVIAMNLKEIASLGKLSASIHNSADVHSCWLVSGGHRSLLIHSWHFSAWRKKDMADYYDPIRGAILYSETVPVARQPVGENQI